MVHSSRPGLVVRLVRASHLISLLAARRACACAQEPEDDAAAAATDDPAAGMDGPEAGALPGSLTSQLGEQLTAATPVKLPLRRPGNIATDIMLITLTEFPKGRSSL
jgi:hypothetical protein